MNGYTYLKHPIKFLPGDWEKHLGMINKAVGEINRPK